MTATRKAALVAGLFYIATFVFSIPALGLYDGVVNDPINVILASVRAWDDRARVRPSCRFHAAGRRQGRFAILGAPRNRGFFTTTPEPKRTA